MKISGCIISYNEEAKIEDCLKSLKDIVDEIVIIDSGSKDGTIKIAKKYTNRIYHKDFLGHVAQKNYCISKAKHEWILSLDCDERLSNKLKRTIVKIKNSESNYDAYKMPRRTFYVYQWLKHCWFPDYKIRLFNRKKAKWQGINPHDMVQPVKNSRIKRLQEEILHYSFDSISDHLKTIDFFTEIAANHLIERNKKATLFTALSHSWWIFIKIYFFKFGFLDGLAGFTVAKLSSYHVFTKYIKLIFKKRKKIEQNKSRERILIVETDKIGDVLLTLPAVNAVRKAFPDSRIDFLINPNVKDIIINNPDIDNILLYKTKKDSELLEKIKTNNYNSALILFPDPDIAFLLNKAGIKERISYGYKWYQFLFTRTKIQHRSRVDMHQAEYNLELAEMLDTYSRKMNSRIFLTKNETIKGNKILKKIFKHRSFTIGIHPGSGSSSPKPSIEIYSKLINLISSKFKNINILTTQGKEDRGEIAELIKLVPSRVKILPPQELRKFCSVIANLDCFISNSTGPIHIASALQVPVIGFYSPVKAQRPERWGPLNKKQLMIIPDIKCPGTIRCLKEKCKYHPCMEKVEYKQAVKFISSLK